MREKFKGIAAIAWLIISCYSVALLVAIAAALVDNALLRG